MSATRLVDLWQLYLPALEPFHKGELHRGPFAFPPDPGRRTWTYPRIGPPASRTSTFSTHDPGWPRSNHALPFRGARSPNVGVKLESAGRPTLMRCHHHHHPLVSEFRQVRRAPFRRTDFEQFGFTDNCPGCANARAGRKQAVDHSEQRRSRMETIWSTTTEGHERLKRARDRFAQAAKEPKSEERQRKRHRPEGEGEAGSCAAPGRW